MPHSLTWAGLALLTPLALPSQDTPSRLTPVGVADPALVEVGQGNAPTTQELERLLTTPDLDERMAHYERLLTEVRDPSVRQGLEALAAGSSGEAAWSARLLLREARAGRMLARPGTSPMPFFDSLFGLGPGRRLPGRSRPLAPQGGQPLLQGGQSSSSSVTMQQGPDGVRVEVRTYENGDESVEVYEGDSLEQLKADHPELEVSLGPQVGRTAPGISPFGGGEPFQGLDAWELHEQLLEGLRSGEAFDRLWSTPRGEGSDSSNPAPESKPPAPRRLRRMEDQLRSLEQEREALEDELRRLLGDDGGVEAKTPPRLGVYVLEEDEGLRVQSVLPESLAARCGVQPGDRLRALEGKVLERREVRSTSGIARFLEELQKEEGGSAGLKVHVLDASGTEQVRTPR